MTNTVRHLNIEVTRRCDQRCSYCFNNSGPAAFHDEMTVGQWNRFICHMTSKGLKSVHITGGEPFVSSIAIPLITEAQRLGLSTSVLSNGLRISVIAKKHAALFQKLTLAQISLDSMNPGVHDRRRGKPGAWRQAMAAIYALQELGVPLELSCTLDQENQHDIGDLAIFARTIGASIILRPVVSIGRGCSYTIPRARQTTERLISEIEDILVVDRFHYVPTNSNSDRDALDAGILTVLPDGRFRIGPVSSASTVWAWSATELLEAA